MVFDLEEVEEVYVLWVDVRVFELVGELVMFEIDDSQDLSALDSLDVSPDELLGADIFQAFEVDLGLNRSEKTLNDQFFHVHPQVRLH